LEKTITFVGDLIDSLGGLPGLLTTISVLLLNTFGNSLAKGLTDAALGIKSLTKAGREEIKQTKYKALDESYKMTSE
jgi:hypothetical protein